MAARRNKGGALSELDDIAYLMLGLSLSASAVQVGRWFLNADPRAIINAGRWSLAGVIGLAPLVLVWLVISGRSTVAMMLAAFMLPVFVQGALRWRSLFDGLGRRRGRIPDLDAGIAGSRPAAHGPVDPALVRQSLAVLQAYLAEAASCRERRISPAEAFAVLGLEPTASRGEIREAHRRLREKVGPESGGTHYLAAKINEARDVLLGDSRQC